MKEKPFEYSNEQVLAGLTEKGTGRAFLITGKDRSWQKEELERICSRVSQRRRRLSGQLLTQESLGRSKTGVLNLQEI